MNPADLDLVTPEFYTAMHRRYAYDGGLFTDRDYQELYDALADCKRRGIDPSLENLYHFDSEDYKARKRVEQVHRRILRIEGAHQAKRNGTRTEFAQRLHENLGGYAGRVENHHTIEAYMKSVAQVVGAPLELQKKIANMHDCHHSGVCGERPTGEQVIAWDYKCNDTRLCSHAAWRESKRLGDIYHDAIIDQINADPKRRLFYAVLTIPNVPEGKLLEGKQRIFELTKLWREHKAVATPLIWSETKNRYLRSDRNEVKPFCLADTIEGALVTQEDPLGNNYTWHPHNNLIMITRGQFDYHLAREWWSEIVFSHKRDPRRDDQRAVLHFAPVDKAKLADTLIEIIKYPVQTVAEKSQDSDTAPALTDWPPSLFIEWYRANQGFRRTRSYGCLYAIDGKRWNSRLAQQRYDDFFQPARERGYVELDLDYVYRSWTDIPEKDRAKLKRQMRQPEVYSMDDVTWIGQVLWLESQNGYYVDLSAPGDTIRVASIPGDNFLASSAKNNNFSQPPPVH